jgi:hypothetical protein
MEEANEGTSKHSNEFIKNSLSVDLVTILTRGH